ncbi:MAG TPA: amino acid adenylation domain-containing protein [Thermoanaerobaculia bacterium]|nr:amino acid adenylation domain-containing protein [Thermoanaerobaculia bacterium]
MLADLAAVGRRAAASSRPSVEQERTARLLAADPGAYRMRAAVDLAGEIDAPALAAAFADALERSDVLAAAAGVPVWHSTAVERRDLARRTDAFLDAPGIPGAPLTAELLRLDGRSARLLLSLPPIAADRATLGLFVRDLARCYAARRGGPAPAQLGAYGEYAEWQRELRASEDAEPERAFWRRLPPDAVRDPGLPPLGPAGRFAPASVAVACRPDLLARLAGPDGETVALAAWAALCARLAARREVVIAVASAGRAYAALEATPGPFARFLPVRFEVAPERSFGRLRSAVAEAVEEALAFEDAFAWADLEPAGEEGEPLIAALGFERIARAAPVSAAGATFALVAERAVGERFALALRLRDAEAGPAIDLDFDRGRIAEGEASRLAGRFATLLAAALADERSAAGDLALLPPDERALVLCELNRTARDLGAGPLDELVLAQARRTPERTAIRAGDRAVEYGELAAMVRSLAARLAAAGVGPETPVGVCAERSPEMVAGLLAILAAGGAFLPLDPEHPKERLAAILDDARPPAVLAGRGAPAWLAARAGLAVIDLPGALAVAAAPARWSPPRGDLDRLAYLLFTSGSTGRPKGVMMSHGAIVNRLLWQQADHPLGASDRVLQKTPYGFDASLWELFLPLLAGAELVLAAPGSHRDAGALRRAVAAERITVLQLVPSLLPAFLDEAAAGGCRDLRLLFCGGEELPSDLVERARAELGAEVVNLYGPTEAAIDAASWRCRDGVGPRAAPIGRPIANGSIVLLDARFQPVPAGIPGELAIGGAGLARGYLGRADLTAERFVPDPFASEGGEPGARLYRTGDLARHLPGGELEYLGRIDRQVKVRGVRVEPGEIELHLRAHPSVREAAVAARPGSGRDLRLIAYVVAREGGEISPSALEEFLAARLPDAMVPRIFVELARLPRLPNGKLDAAALPAPRPAATALPATLAPLSDLEALVASVWSEILGVERPGPGDDFFALGGHSLSATRLASRLGRRLGVEFPLQAVFDAPTVSTQAAAAEAALRSEAGLRLPALARCEREEGGELPLSFAQARLWFFERMRPGTATFNIAVAFRLRGDLDLAALRAAFDAVLRRHEMLRTTFPDRRGRPVQVVGPPWRIPAPLADLSALPEARREREQARRVMAAALQPFDLATGPLLRLELARLAPRELALAFVVHHVASDAWSAGVLTRELLALYRAARDGEPSPLPELPFQYADYAAWQRSWPAEALDAEVAYWRGQLAGAPPLVELPADRPRPEAFSYRGATRAIELPLDLSLALGALARGQGATPFMTLFAAFSVLLARATGRTDLVLGTDVAGRKRWETEGLIGFFINQLALRVDSAGDPTFAAVLAAVRSTALSAYAHQDLPFELVVDALRVPRSLGAAPLFQVKLFFDNTPPGDYGLPGLEIEQIESETPIAKLDLTIALKESGGRLSGWINYATDLFDAARIDRLVERYTDLLRAVAERPEARLSELGAALHEIERKELAMAKSELKELSFKKFKAVAPQALAITGELVEKSYLAPDQRLPLVIRPAVADVDLAEWAASRKEEIEADLLAHGAILFRGFGISEPAVLERFASQLCPDLFNENGEHPRESVTGNVYTPVFYPPDQRLLWHNENSFNWSWPRVIFFACARPADAGGETPIVDSRRVYAELDPEVRDTWERLGVSYQRNYAEGLGLPWRTVFRAATREEVEGSVQASHMRFEWRDGDRLCTYADRPAVIRHPVTREASWFNQAQHWHVSCLDAATRRSMRALFADRDLPRHCTFGDGSPIPDEHMTKILDLYDRLEVVFPWQQGDVVMLDNVLCAHGRNPFEGPRKILVAMGRMTSYDDV